jgi:hypothetical protein
MYYSMQAATTAISTGRHVVLMGWTRIMKIVKLREITRSTNKNQIPAKISKKGWIGI